MSENDRALDLRLPRAGGEVATEEITNFLQSLRTLLAQRVARLEVMYAGLEDQYDQIDQVTVLDVISVTCNNNFSSSTPLMLLRGISWSQGWFLLELRWLLPMRTCYFSKSKYLSVTTSLVWSWLISSTR